MPMLPAAVNGNDALNVGLAVSLDAAHAIAGYVHRHALSGCARQNRVLSAARVGGVHDEPVHGLTTALQAPGAVVVPAQDRVGVPL